MKVYIWRASQLSATVNHLHDERAVSVLALDLARARELMEIALPLIQDELPEPGYVFEFPSDSEELVVLEEVKE